MFFALPLQLSLFFYPFFSYTLPSLPSNLSYRLLVKIVDGGLHTNIPQTSGAQPLVCHHFNTGSSLVAKLTFRTYDRCGSHSHYRLFSDYYCTTFCSSVRTIVQCSLILGALLSLYAGFTLKIVS